MWDEITLEPLFVCLVTAALVGAGLGLLEQSRLRSRLIWAWALLPVGFNGVSAMVGALYGLAPAPMFLAFVLLVTLAPWASLAVLSYIAVRRVREHQDAKRLRDRDGIFE